MSHTDSDVEDIPYDYEGQGEEEGGIEAFEEQEEILRSEDFISAPYYSKHCTLTSDILEFE